MASKQNITKRVQIDKTKSLLLILVAGASAITVFCLVASKTYFSETSYLNRIASEKEKALKQLKANKKAAVTLAASYKTFAAADPNALGGTPAGKGEKDGDNARLVLDALPSKYDFPALTASLEKLLSGYTINNITGSDDGVVQDQPATETKPVEMPFSINVGSDYKGIQTLVTTFERSIRPFQISTLDLTGTNTALIANIGSKTYYQPEKTLDNGSKVIK
ncbi:hypothetical protein BH10PAT3_BH10PAT3_8880 [soil metagenome]